MSLRDRLSEAGGRAAALGSTVRTSARPVAVATSLAEQLAALPRPAAPATEPWAISVATLVGGGGSVPPLAMKALGLLDRFGRVGVGPDQVAIDGDDLPWTAVTTVRTAPVAARLSEDVVRRELDRVKRLLPPMPGRGWVLRQVGSVLGGLIGRALPAGATAGGTVVSALETTGRLGRHRTVEVGLAGSLVLMALPEVDRSIRATAEQHGIPVLGASLAPTAPPVSPDRLQRLVEEDLGTEAAGEGTVS